MRLDIKVAEVFSLSREKAKHAISSGNISVNGTIIVKPSFVTQAEDVIQILSPIAPKPSSLKKSDIPLDIIYEDEFIIIINKQAGVSTHPPSIEGEGTIANGILNIFEASGLRPGIVHRLDKETTGLLIVAKTEESTLAFSNLIAERLVERKYLALMYGNFNQENMRIQTFIERSRKNRLKMQISKIQGKVAITNFSLQESWFTHSSKQINLVECKLETGRTHQIRLHAEYNKTAIVGDTMYGLQPPSFFERYNQNIDLYNLLKGTTRQMLHAFSLKFIHPFTNQEVFITQEPPKDFNNIIKILNS